MIISVSLQCKGCGCWIHPSSDSYKKGEVICKSNNGIGGCGSRNFEEYIVTTEMKLKALKGSWNDHYHNMSFERAIELKLINV